MPKLKTKKGAAKRFRFTKTGKVRYQSAGKRHLLEHKSSKTKRQARNAGYLKPCDAAQVARMLPYA